VTVLTTDFLAQPGVALPREERKGGVRIVRVANKMRLAGYGFAPAIVGWLKSHWREFDVAHCHGYNRFATEFAVLFLKGKIPVVFTAHGFYHTKRNAALKRAHKALLGGRAARAADACVAITSDDEREFLELGVRPGKIVPIPNGVEVGQFRKRTTAGSFAKHSPYVLFVGRLHESKGLSFLLQAIAPLRCNLVLVGADAGYEKELRIKAEKLGLSRRVVFAGELSQQKLVQAMAGCSLLALASEWEAFGLVLVEAMAAGKPVVASDLASIRQVVQDGKQGFLVAYGDVAALREKIELLLNDKALAQKMGQQGAKKALEYSWKSVGLLTEKIYYRLLHDKKNRF